jgi:hypothetical protein
MICIASGNIQHIIQRVLRRYAAPFPLTEAIFMQNGAGTGIAGTASTLNTKHVVKNGLDELTEAGK